MAAGVGKSTIAVLGYASCSSIMCACTHARTHTRRVLFCVHASSQRVKRPHSAQTPSERLYPHMQTHVCWHLRIRLVINKLAVHYLPAPSFVLLAQVTCSWVAVKVMGMLGFIDVDEIEPAKMRAFFPVAFAFLACIYANIKTLQFANVETFIVFRASTPLLIGVAEWALMGRELPSMRSLGAMLALVGGAVGYVLTDAAFVVTGYVWVGVWYVIFCFDQCVFHSHRTRSHAHHLSRDAHVGSSRCSLDAQALHQACSRHDQDALQLGARLLHQPLGVDHALPPHRPYRAPSPVDNAMDVTAGGRALALVRSGCGHVLLRLPLPRGRLGHVIHRHRQCV